MATILDATDEGSEVQCIRSLFVTSSTACSINLANDTSVVTRDPHSVSIYDDAGDCIYTEYIYASDCDPNRTTGSKNFSYFEDFMTGECRDSGWFDGWTWIDAYYNNVANTSYDNQFYSFISLALLVNGDETGYVMHILIVKNHFLVLRQLMY